MPYFVIRNSDGDTTVHQFQDKAALKESGLLSGEFLSAVPPNNDTRATKWKKGFTSPA